MEYHPSSRRASALVVTLFGFGLSFLSTSSTASAQTLYGLDGAASGAIEFTGPPAGPCGYPSGPVLSGFPTAVPFVCPTAAVPGPPPGVFGDIAVNKLTDTVWVTDGGVITEYTPGGAVLTSFALPILAVGPLTGLGFDSPAGLLWVTDGVVAAAIVPPAPPGCGPALVAIPPFPLPVGALATDIEWDSRTATLWVCDLGGAITNVVIGGGIGPFGVFPAGGILCPIGPALQGIAVDDAAAVGTIYVTDGAAVAYLDATTGGGPAPLTFYTTATCTPTPGPLVGLAFAAHAVPYGTGTDSSGGIPPVMTSFGQSVSPTATLGFTITGGIPGATAGLLYGSTGAACPPVFVAGVGLLVFPPLFTAGTITLTATGTGTIITPIPPGLLGSSFWLQWLVAAPGPVLQMTNAMEVTGSAP